ncbi:putative ATP-dependent RNA helicase TDRD12 isoform X2 [Pseudoliparis swirei]|uniref:putative ATP-dependent RNA helicase TDRD12 isoform X2 n=1 Tax=Pseudoliparis swirei TaxID=2059687 RepID=UPI0024BDEFA2|nr:putative ATP-dependent RNA helicase TDRD12 isoform X2 [Pseudoliparis swirei]
MLEISILTVENPSCLWGRVVQGPSDQYDRLLAQMNLFYHDLTRDPRQLKPAALEEGQVCVVYWSVMKSWCRAVVESIFTDSVSCQARCLLVDQGERLIVPSDKIRVAAPSFLQLPFWVRRFQLAGIKPTTLRVSVYEEEAGLIRCSQWDSSATLYLHSLLQASTLTEAVLLEALPGSTGVELYVTVGGVKICVKDDLVAKRFAYYSGALEEVDRRPVMLASSVLTQTAMKPTPRTTRAPHGFPSFGQQRKLEASEQGSGSTVTDQQHGPNAAAESDSSLAASLKKNLSLFRFLKFLNPADGEPAAPTVSQRGAGETTTAQEETSETGGESLEEETSVGASVGSSEKPWRTKEDRARSRLLQWLNPEPPSDDPDATDAEASGDPARTWGGVLVHSALPVTPCSGLDDAPITDALRSVLRRKSYGAPSAADRYAWPAVARGCNVAVVSPDADQPLGYVAPLLSHMLLNSIFTSLTSSAAGPVAVLLCPGWQKVQAVYDLLDETKAAAALQPISLLLGVKGHAHNTTIPKNCLLLVTTPFSLVRLLASHCFLFLRLSHLVLDEADRLFALAPDQMATILQHFQKVTSGEEMGSCPQQLVAVATRWTGHMEALVANHMPCPCIVVAAPEEAALYGNVQQIILMTLESNKATVMLSALDFNPDEGQKTLIVANSAEEVEDVFKVMTFSLHAPFTRCREPVLLTMDPLPVSSDLQVVSNKSAFCLKTHEGLTHQFDVVMQQWRKDIGPGTHVILVTTSECLRCLGVRDATCVVHYGFPPSPKQFGVRLSCMADGFRNLSARVPPEDSTGRPPARGVRSVLLISERNAGHVVGVLRYLERTNAPLPPELLVFARRVYEAREDQKTDRPLCGYLKSFGVCRAGASCPDRHRFVPQLDRSALPASGLIEFVPLHVKTASVFWGRLVQKEEEGGGGFGAMAAQMEAHFHANGKPAATELLEGGVYAVQQDQAFHRVKLLSVPPRGDRLFFSVEALFLDVGKEAQVKSHQVLQLPERFHSLPGQAVEVVVCRVQPADGETDWHPKVTRAINQRIRGRQHRARAVFSLGNTVFVDPMVCVTQLPDMKTVINEYSVRAEILSTGMAVGNQQHLDLLRALCHEGPEEGPEEGPVSESGGGPPSPGGGVDAEVLDDLPQLEPLRPASAPQTPPAAKLRVVQSPLLAGQATACLGAARPADLESAETLVTFHPPARWYQTPDSAIVTVKLRNPESQRCDFYADRVVYSCRANGRAYRADLLLHGDVAVERCSWEMKSNEPVLKLAKGVPGHWDRLLRSKNIFVSYDTEHIDEDEDEDRTPDGPRFVEDEGEDNRYVNLESDSD